MDRPELKTKLLEFLSSNSDQKTLLIKGRAGSSLGTLASGVIVNNSRNYFEVGLNMAGVLMNMGRVDDSVGEDSCGVVINFGETKYWLGHGATGVVLNFGEAHFKHETEPAAGFDHPDDTPLREYCEDLRRKYEMMMDASPEELSALVLQLPKAEVIKEDITILVEDLP